MSNEPAVLDSLKASARDAPRLPGVYLWKDGDGQIIYIGKAKSLRDRLGSYFARGKDVKTATLVRRARSIETILVANEYEALLLENTLIKQHSPRYNIDLKDGKSYPVIRITGEDFPRVFKTRRIVEDGSQYYGPFPNVHSVDALLELVDKLFPLRKCKAARSAARPGARPALRKRRGPCIYYHIGRCMAPCCGKITVGEYRLHVERVQRLLSGETGPLIVDLTEKMREAARALQFEWAAQIRNAIRAIEDLAGEGSAVVDFDPEGRDYIAWAAQGVLATYTVFSMRGGKMTGRELYRARSAADEGESLEIFVTSYYDGGRPPPAKIFLEKISHGGHGGMEDTGGNASHGGAEGTGDTGGMHLTEGAGDTGGMHLTNGAEGTERDFLEKTSRGGHGGNASHGGAEGVEGTGGMHLTEGTGRDFLEKTSRGRRGGNASHGDAESTEGTGDTEGLLKNWFREKFGFEPELLMPGEKHHAAIMAMAHQNAAEDVRKRVKERGAGPVLDELARALQLTGRPERIEGFDIAQLDGKHPVASLVSFKNGVPDRKNYRYFKLRSVIGVVDDFAAMREAVQRRYSRLIREGKDLPDLILIDGGIGQVNAAKGVMDELGMGCGVVGLAKHEEELWLPHAQEPLVLPRRSEALKVLQFVRDETHRFATGLNQRLRSKDLLFPALESVDGIGKQRAAAIMKAYENIENIAAAAPAEIAKRCRISEASAKAVRAAARLALKDRVARTGQLATGRGRRAGKGLGESLAAEAAPEYGTGTL